MKTTSFYPFPSHPVSSFFCCPRNEVTLLKEGVFLKISVWTIRIQILPIMYAVQEKQMCVNLLICLCVCVCACIYGKVCVRESLCVKVSVLLFSQLFVNKNK